ncbi:MAG TPA: lysine--tRNA ligase, partial [Candidatus Nanoarchaeia archaeon]|nr:lysine--tRNA ligase [Candidatus Nanoarchaeia archaeon]
PEEFEKYIGMPVTDVPDPDGNFKSYAERFKAEYFEVIDEFLTTKMEKFSMREEYKKGNFTSYIKKIMEKIEDVKEIQNRYRTNPLKSSWSPWTPICDSCGKIVTTHTLGIENGIVKYECQDYEFETTTAKGCGHKGENDPLKGNGKLLWKSEWAAQWARWKVVSEGAGKEYQVPNSAWWINGEITEKVLNYPMPEPIFYEHITIDNQKMSASVGNVVYPKDWLEVASPELLRLFYNKRLMTTRSFSWKDLPNLYDEYDKIAEICLGKTVLENKKEEAHYKRLFEVSCGKDAKKPIDMSFSHAAVIAQTFPDEEEMIKGLEKTGHYDKNDHDRIFERFNKVKLWLKKHAPEDVKFEVQKHVSKDITITDNEKKALHETASLLKENDYTEQTLFEEFYAVATRHKVKPAEFFRSAYRVLLNKERGPKLAPFVLALGKEKAAKLFESA